MKKRLVVPIVIILALPLCACVHFRDVQPIYSADTAQTEFYAPVIIETAAPDSSAATEANTETVTAAEPAVQFSVSDIAENGRSLDLYGVEMNSALAGLEAELNAYDGKISFVAYGIAGETALSYNSVETYCGHCTVKAGYMLYCCKAIESGAARADELLTYHERHYDSGAGIIKNDPFGTSYTIEKLIRLNLSVSDNAAYKMLVERFGKSDYNDFITGIGAESLRLEDYTIWANRTKPLDLIKVWREIYNYFATESDIALLMKEACTGTINNYITEGVPGLEYSHKSGEYFYDPPGFHDAAIVWNERPYLICAMSDSDGEEHVWPFSMIINTVNYIFTE